MTSYLRHCHSSTRVFPCEQGKATVCAKAVALIRGKSLITFLKNCVNSF